MKKSDRLWFCFAALLLTGVFFAPIWTIDLEAPQYPEGIGLEIWVNQIRGESPQDLQNINGLNHYIGMKTIEPESIPELKIMPYLFGILIISGLAIASWGSRNALLAWLVVFGVMAVVGLVDFYIWEYDYGHDLDPNAPIKVPGMSYQPPLIGTKQLLNMRTTSLPGPGFCLALISMGTGAFIWWRSKPDADTSEDFAGAGDSDAGGSDRDKGADAQTRLKKSVKYAVSVPLLSILLLGGCSREPFPVHYGEDACAHCRMVIMDSRFATQLVNTRGKAWFFDSIECMAAFTAGEVDVPDKVDKPDEASYWVSNFESPGEWINIEMARIMKHPDVNSPMGLSYFAVPKEDGVKNVALLLDSVALSWQEVMEETGAGHSAEEMHQSRGLLPENTGHKPGSGHAHEIWHSGGSEHAAGSVQMPGADRTTNMESLP